MYPRVVMRSLELAARWHKGQTRKHPSEEIPYIAHPAGVGMLLMRAGFDDEIIAAGILHDVVEDCGVTLEDLASAMTPRIAELVSWVTEPSKSVPWSERKRVYRERLAMAPHGALAIATADHLHNMESLISSVQTSGDVWTLFHIDKQTKMVHERQVFNIVHSGLGASPLVDLLGVVLDKIEQLS